jgi:hypothetical protein
MLTRIIIASSLIGLSACGRVSPASRPNESPDFANSVSQFGIEGQLSWDDIQNYKTVSLSRVPWTDTYWPLARVETAARWGAIPSDQAAKGHGFSSSLAGLVAESKKSEPSVLLSPAEKYDLVFGWRYGSTLDALAQSDLLQKSISLESQIDAAGNDFVTAKKFTGDLMNTLMSENFATVAPLTANAWQQYLGYSSNPDYLYKNTSGEGEAWGWMGICHGWAPAAVMAETPKHGVEVNFGDKKVLFTEGDIRGLLSRAWAQAAPDSYFLGRRCNDSVSDTSTPIPANAKGKGYAGKLAVDGLDGVDSARAYDVTVAEHYFTSGVQVTINGRRIPVTVSRLQAPGLGELYVIEVSRYRPDESVRGAPAGSSFALVTRKFSDVAMFLKNSEMTDGMKYGAVKYSGCWDVNPASFHHVIVDTIGRNDVGFVMDRTRTGQVWNQPVYATKFQISDLKAVGTIKDVAASYRASGTAYVAEVVAEVLWSSEPHAPKMFYPAGFDKDHLRASTFRYTLEFDADKNLIGGEWGTLAQMDNSASGAPDFLFAYKKGSTPVDDLSGDSGKIDYSGVIGVIHQCSLAAPDAETTIDGRKYPVKRCVIQKAR